MTLNLKDLKDFIADKFDLISKYRPQLLFIPRVRGRRKYETAIRRPNKYFFDLMEKRKVYFWIVVKKHIDQNMKKELQHAYESVKGLSDFPKAPICTNINDCLYWIKECPCQIVLFQDIFFEVFDILQSHDNAAGFHVISPENNEISNKARENRKIRNIYDDQKQILTILKQNMERLKISEEEKVISKTLTGGQEYKRLLVRNSVFPNFIKLSKHDKSEHNQYRLHLIGLRKLTEEDKLASKDQFIELSRQQFPKSKYPNEQRFIEQYSQNIYDDPKEILRFYTLDSFFYRILNNTLRIATNSEEFFSIGEPFNKVFDAIKQLYDANYLTNKQELNVFRGADLTASECQYLEENIGGYIQVNGFISTSKNCATAKDFAKQRNNNTLFQIILRKVPQKYKQYDYGYVDLEVNKCSAFDEDEVLINALNVFRIVGKQNQDGFEIYKLQYGAIFTILENDPSELKKDSDRYAYYSFKQLNQMNSQIKDIGEVYLRTLEPEKAIQIYEFQLSKLQNEDEGYHREEVEDVLIKAADAYLANGDPDKALKYYQSIFIKKKNRQEQLLRSQQEFKKSGNIKDKHKNSVGKIQQVQKVSIKVPSIDYIQNSLIDIKDEQAMSQKSQRGTAELILISTKVSSIQTNCDNYEASEQNYLKISKQLKVEQQKEESKQVFWSSINLQWQRIQSKKTQQLYQQAFGILKDVNKSLLGSLDSIKEKEPYEEKKLRFKLTEVYEYMAQISQLLQTEKNSIQDIESSFSKMEKKLRLLIEKNSYQEGLLNFRKSEILRRTKHFNQEQESKNYKSAIKLMKSQTTRDDKNLPLAYNAFASMKKNSLMKNDNSQAKSSYKKQLRYQTIIYGNQDVKPLHTRMDIAICQKDDKNTIQALQQFDKAYNTKLFNKQQKYSIHAKVLYNMAHAYSDKGDEGLAMKSLKQAYSILQQRLHPKDFQKSVLRYKIKLKIGRLYMTESIRKQTTDALQFAQTNLREFHQFIIHYYNYPHSDKALSFNCLGALYSTQRKFKDSKKNYQKSIQIYEETVGQRSIDVAKIKANLSICLAQLQQFSKATKTLKQSTQIFNKIYDNLRKLNPYQYESYYIQAEIETLQGSSNKKFYQKAIDSCNKSIFYEKQFNETKKKLSDESLKKKTQNQESLNYLSVEMPREEIYANSLIIRKNNPVISQEEVPRMFSDNPVRKSVAYISEHSLKCEFKICQNLIYLKLYQQAKVKLLKLRDDLDRRIKEERYNYSLFKDNVHSKKQLYLKKSNDYLQKVNKALRNREQKERQKMEKLAGNNQGATKNQNGENLDFINEQQVFVEDNANH